MSTTDSDYSFVSKHNFSLDGSQNLNKYFSHLNINKINSIPLTRKDLANSPYERNRLQITGYKHFSKISASGKGTYKVLRYMRQSQNLKTINALEFDPYLCDSSFLTDLTQALKKFRKIKNFNLVIPRVDRKNESNILYPFIRKLRALTRLRLDVPSPENINEDGLAKLLAAFRRLYLLKFLETKFTNIAEPSNKFEMQLMECNRHHQKLEELVSYHSVKKGTIKEEYNYALPYKLYCIPTMKKLNIVCSVSSEWASRSGDGSLPTEELCLEFITQFPNLEEFSVKFINSITESDDLLGALTVMGKMPHLKTLTYESLNCRMGDLEMMTVLFGLTKMPNIKNLCFKVIQHPSVSEMSIARFVEVVSKQPNIENFDFYVRRLNLPEEVLSQFVNEVCKMNKVYCKRYKGSLHFYRYKESNIHEIEL